MFDKDIALDSLLNIESALNLIIERAAVANTPDDFLCSPDGMLHLDAICMNLIALGEAVKGLDALLADLSRHISLLVRLGEDLQRTPVVERRWLQSF